MWLYKNYANSDRMCNQLFLLNEEFGEKDVKVIYYKDYICKNKIKNK